MASRMERYNQSSDTAPKRSEKNVVLYEKIYDTPEYSNIEGIATMERTNEIDITKLKKTLQNREQYQRGRDYQNLITRKEEPKKEVTEIKYQPEERNYDIRDILNKAKTNQPNPESAKYRTLKNTNYNVLKSLNINNKQPIKENLHDIIDTITNTSLLHKINDKDLSLDLLDDLRSEGNTTIGSKDAIREILEQAKQEELKQKKEEHKEIDKSFYTSSLSFNDSDFEQLLDINHNLKRNNILIKVLLVVFGIFVLGAVAILVFNLLK